jgi:hypothetical protein
MAVRQGEPWFSLAATLLALAAQGALSQPGLAILTGTGFVILCAALWVLTRG